nr:hypothetical protein [Vibrio rumoiensis]
MTKFYVYLRSFLIDNEIRLVLLHNDLRWQHSIAVMLCKEMNIDYLVTEQGLFRPITTIVDRHGVNANSRVKDEYLSFVGKGEDIKSYYSNEIVNSSHDSLYSYINFFRYLVFSKLGTFLGREARVVHKRHTFSEYIKRFYVHKCTSLFSNKIDLFSEKTNSSSKKLIFVPLQLELDTQFLVHSDFSKIQEVIDLIQQSFTELGLGDNYELVFKLHPNDLNKYSFESYSKITKANIDNNFLENVSLVISVNSSALLQVLSTNTPIITLGRSIYNFENVSIESNKENLVSNIRVQLSENIDMDKRRHYIEYLRFVYSIQGAGNSFSEKQIDRIIDMLDRG